MILVARRDDGSALLALANAYDHAFSTCFAEGSRWFLARLRGRFLAGEPVEAALGAAAYVASIRVEVSDGRSSPWRTSVETRGRRDPCPGGPGSKRL